jgi:phosphohistidine phosphatase
MRPILYLIRHADALDGEVDTERPLSPKGCRQVRHLARFLKESKAADLREIWHSPLVRARQTAAGLADELGAGAALREARGLLSDDPPGTMAKRLRDAELPLALVGHNPHLESLATLLVTGASQPCSLVLRKCAILALEPVRGQGAGQWAAAWQLSPDQF